MKSELTLILKGDDKEHNGDCNPIKSIDQLIEQNNITNVYDSFVIKSRNKKYNQYVFFSDLSFKIKIKLAITIIIKVIQILCNNFA